jgi:hypothetical protein
MMSGNRSLFGIRKIFGSGPRMSSTSASESPDDAKTAYLLQAYNLAQKHYDSDLQLFSARMNLFLLVQSALVAVTGSSILGGGDGQSGDYRGAISVFGLILAVAWLLVAVSSYAWVKTWRAHMMVVGTCLKNETSVLFSSALFDREARKSSYPKDAFWTLVETFSWIVRPTLVTCCLPLLFIGGWIYLGIHAHWSGV